MKKKAYFFSKKSTNLLDKLRSEGEVHSVFDTSLNILIPPSSFLTLLAKKKEIYRNPISIVIDIDSFRGLSILPEDPVIYTGDAIIIGDKKLIIDTKDRITWDASFRYFGPLLSPSSIEKNVDTLKFFIKIMNWNKGMLPLVIEEFPHSHYTQKAKSAIERLRGENILSKAGFSFVGEGLIGLGDGLTPSGDDFLSGFLVILYYFAKYLDLEDVIGKKIKEILSRVFVRTNLLSAVFLTLAGQGYAFFLLREIIKDLLGRRGFDMENIRNLIEYGDSSGASILAGLIFGIEYTLRYLYRETKEVLV